MLIGEGEIIKISDFGTSRTLNDVSEKMSFAGTVAWMAPEALRESACSEKVDIWSFGVVLWELLTCEVPYNGMEQSAIMYLVGIGQLTPPIPSSCPDGFKLIMQMCWKMNPRERPSFKLICNHLEIAAVEVSQKILSFRGSFLSSFLSFPFPPFIPSFISSFLHSPLPFFIHFFIFSFLPYFISFFFSPFLPFFRSSFLPSFISSFLPSILICAPFSSTTFVFAFQILSMYKDEQFFKTQESWKEEIKTQITQFKVHLQKCKKEFKLEEERLIINRERELKHIRDIKELYDHKLERVNEIYMELSTFLLELKQQKQDCRKREMQGKRKLIPPFMRKLERRRTSNNSTTPTSPECSLTSPDSPQSVSIAIIALIIYLRKTKSSDLILNYNGVFQQKKLHPLIASLCFNNVGLIALP